MRPHGITSLRGTAPGAVPTPAAPSRSTGIARPGDRLLDPVIARIVATLALVAFGSVHWMMMVAPTAYGRWAACLGIAVLTVAGMLLARPRRGLRRAAVILVTLVAGFALALLAGGVAADDLRPHNWDVISSQISGGLTALPGARIPYRGLDEQLRLVIPLGGTVLTLLATALAMWPRRRDRIGVPGVALIALVTLYAVPAVSLILDAEFLRGALLALLVVAYLRLDRLRRREAPAAGAVLAVAAILALVIAPALDKPDPWWDYEDWAESAAGAKSTSFSWDHNYGALNWPRDGRELLRIKSPQRSYWKADELDVFNGLDWVRDEGAQGRNDAGVLFGGVDLGRYARWTFDVQVTVRGLKSSTLPLSGSADNVDLPGREADQIRPGVWTVGRPIRRGDAYRAEVYLPQPSVEDLQSAGTDYSVELLPYTSVDLVSRTGPGSGRPVRTWSDTFFGSEPVLPDYGSVPAGNVLNQSDMRRTYRLARRLLAQSPTPYAYVKAIQRYLEDGFTYSETPPPGSRTLDGFLFDTKSGFCQHYSGAMALLLRLGGVPARVATGFAPGSFDKKTKEYIVRDLDAHSWVEAFFPGIGWVTFDPTPAAAPPRSQALADAPTAASGDIRDLGTTQNTTPRSFQPAGDGANVPWPLIALGVLAAGGLGWTGRVLWRRRGRPHAPGVLELERALAGAGDLVPPNMTLQALEARYRASPAVARYAAALRAERYAPTGNGPTGAQRRGLRRALTHRRGPVTRLRTWLALPPRIRRHRS